MAFFICRYMPTKTKTSRKVEHISRKKFKSDKIHCHSKQTKEGFTILLLVSFSLRYKNINFFKTFSHIPMSGISNFRSNN